MKKIIETVIKVLLTFMLIMPVFGVLGFFPEPTADMYTNEASFNFIKVLFDTKYILVMEAITFLIVAFSIWTKRELLASLLLLPFTFNIVAFHTFLDGGFFTPGAIMGNVLMLINFYFLWKNRKQLSLLLQKSN